MKISHINTYQSFGKQALMTCKIKEKNSQEPKNSTLYKLNPMDEADRKDVFFSKQTYCIAKDFERQWKKPYFEKEFYVLQNDKTGEVISCAETMKRCRPPRFTHHGIYTMIEEANENYKYENGAEPLFAYIAKNAKKNFDLNIFTTFNKETIPNLKSYKFSETRKGEYCIPQRRFSTLIKQAEKKYEMEYCD